ncbi:MAG: hypothetical protein WAN43_01390 [Rhodomicrobium sp.]
MDILDRGIDAGSDAAKHFLGRGVSRQRKLMRFTMGLRGFKQATRRDHLPDAEPFRFGENNVRVEFPVEEVNQRHNWGQEQDANQSKFKPEPKPAHNRHRRTEECMQHLRLPNEFAASLSYAAPWLGCD